MKTTMKTISLLKIHADATEKTLVRFLIFLIQNLYATWSYVNEDISSYPFQDALSGLVYIATRIAL